MKPHPDAVEAVLPTWGFRCSRCGIWCGTLGSRQRGAGVPCDADGHLMCAHCAPKRSTARRKADGSFMLAMAYRWCRRGQHVHTTTGDSGRGCMQSHTRPKVVHTATRCAHCDAEFIPSRSDARFCSAKCRVAAHRARQS